MMEEEDDDSSEIINNVDRLAPSGSFNIPDFHVTSWNPDGAVGMQFLSFVPFGNEANQSLDNHIGKIKVSSTHRKQRLKGVRLGRTSCRNIVDEKHLRTAASQNDLITVIELLEGGADPSCADDKMRSPLHLAASQGYEKMVKVLLDKGADPNRKDFIGNTPLHLAACTCQVPIVTLLLKAGTNIKSVDQYGRTPLALAKSRLQLLVEDTSCSQDKMKTQVLQISDMMKTYLNLSGSHDDAVQLDDLCRRLEQTTTRHEMDQVNLLLSDLAALSIKKKDT